MPKKRNNRKGKFVPKYERDLRAQEEKIRRLIETPGPLPEPPSAAPSTPRRPRKAAATAPPRKRAPRKTAQPVKINKPAVKPSALRRVAPYAVGAAALGGAGYLWHRHLRRNQVRKYYDPFTDGYVEVEKADWAAIGAKIGRRAEGMFTGARRWAAGDTTSAARSKFTVKSGINRTQLTDTRSGGAIFKPKTTVRSIVQKPSGAISDSTSSIGGGLTTGGKVGLATTGAFMGGYTGHKLFGKAYPVAVPVQSSVGLTPRTPSGKYVSHSNDLSVTHYHPKRKINSQLVVIRHGQRTATGSSVGKSLGDYGPRTGRRIPEEIEKAYSIAGLRRGFQEATRAPSLRSKLAPYRAGKVTRAGLASVNRTSPRVAQAVRNNTLEGRLAPYTVKR